MPQSHAEDEAASGGRKAHGFGVLAITLHDTVFDRAEVFADAAANVRCDASHRSNETTDQHGSSNSFDSAVSAAASS